MGDEKLKDFQSTIGEYKRQDDVLEETIKIKRKNIQREADNIGLLEGYRRKRHYVRSMYEDVPEDKISQMGDEEYSFFISTLDSGTVSGGAVDYFYDESMEAGVLYVQHSSALASLDVLAGSDSTSVEVFSLLQPELFPNGNRITQEFKIEDEIDKHIDFIGKELEAPFSEVKEDFDYFVMKFHAFQLDKSQYQDLIGGRSMFFFKLVFDFSEQKYNVKKRIDAIRTFVFGSASPVPSTEPLIKRCRKLYGELSSQDSSGNSVKVGSVSPGYVEGLFRKLVGNIAAILDLRKRYFQP